MSNLSATETKGESLVWQYSLRRDLASCGKSSTLVFSYPEGQGVYHKNGHLLWKGLTFSLARPLSTPLPRAYRMTHGHEILHSIAPDYLKMNKCPTAMNHEQSPEEACSIECCNDLLQAKPKHQLDVIFRKNGCHFLGCNSGWIKSETNICCSVPYRKNICAWRPMEGRRSGST